MKDMAGNELVPGDRVLICVPSYKHLVWATVQSFGAKMIICSYVPHWRRDGVPIQYPVILIR